MLATTKKTTWKIDPAHSHTQFSAKHMMITTVRGRLGQVEGIIVLDDENIGNSTVEATIDVTELHTGDAKRDGHLRSADFLDVEKYGAITFKSTGVEIVSADKLRIKGDLTVRDVTKPVTLDAVIEGRGNTPFGTEVISFSATTQLNRKDWGLTWNVGLEAGGVLVGDTIKIELDVQAVKQAEEAAA